jgi:hypothetical protein
MMDNKCEKTDAEREALRKFKSVTTNFFRNLSLVGLLNGKQNVIKNLF